jgi:hypothetical protein
MKKHSTLRCSRHFVCLCLRLNLPPETGQIVSQERLPAPVNLSVPCTGLLELRTSTLVSFFDPSSCKYLSQCVCIAAKDGSLLLKDVRWSILLAFASLVLVSFFFVYLDIQIQLRTPNCLQKSSPHPCFARVVFWSAAEMTMYIACQYCNVKCFCESLLAESRERCFGYIYF